MLDMIRLCRPYYAVPMALTYTLTLEDGTTPIADALIEVYTEEAMSNLVTSGRTDDDGEVTLYASAGAKYLKRTKSGYSFTNPDEETFS